MLLVVRNLFWPVWVQKWGPRRSWNHLTHFWSFHFLCYYICTVVKTSSNDFIEHDVSKFHLLKVSLAHLALFAEEYIRSPNLHLYVMRKCPWLDPKRVNGSIRQYFLIDVVSFSWKVHFLENLKLLLGAVRKVFFEVKYNNNFLFKCSPLLSWLVN